MAAAADPGLERRLVDVEGALLELADFGVSPTDGRDAYSVVRRVEGLGRRIYSLQVGLLGEIGQRWLFREDGHRSARAMVGYAADLSPASANRRAKAARALRDLPAVAAGLAAGRIGIDQVDRIARTHANSRVRDQLVEVDAHLAVVTAALDYAEFDRYLTAWERLADEDGAGDAAERNHRNRDFKLLRNLDGSYRIEGGCGSLQGTVSADIFDHYVRAEFEADWAEARARLGDDATIDDLARTDAQRRMDALERIFLDAADAAATGTGHQIVTNLVCDLTTFERKTAQACGTDTGPDPRLDSWWQDLAADLETNGDDTETDPGTAIDSEAAGAADSDADAGPVDPDAAPEPAAAPTPPNQQERSVGFRCDTLDGGPIDPNEVVAAAMVGHVRRVVVGADGVVLDMGRKQRLFTGLRHLAVMLSSVLCYWPGCNQPATRCQADHLVTWGGPSPGRTSPDNGAPACGKHNRHRNHGFTTRRDERGHIHVYRPDGTEII